MNKLPAEFVIQDRVGAMQPHDSGWIDPRYLLVDLENNAFLDPDLTYSRVETPKMSLHIMCGPNNASWSITIITIKESHRWKGKVLDPKIKWIRITEIIVR